MSQSELEGSADWSTSPKAEVDSPVAEAEARVVEASSAPFAPVAEAEARVAEELLAEVGEVQVSASAAASAEAGVEALVVEVEESCMKNLPPAAATAAADGILDGCC